MYIHMDPRLETYSICTDPSHKRKHRLIDTSHNGPIFHSYDYAMMLTRREASGS
jgi:hypothetical protein